MYAGRTDRRLFGSRSAPNGLRPPLIPSFTTWPRPKWVASLARSRSRYPWSSPDPSPLVMLSPNAMYTCGRLVPMFRVSGTTRFSVWGTVTMMGCAGGV